MFIGEDFSWDNLHPFYGGHNLDGILLTETGYMSLIGDYVAEHNMIDLSFKRILENFLNNGHVYDRGYVRAAAWLAGGDFDAEEFLSTKIVHTPKISLANALVPLPFFRSDDYIHRLVAFVEKSSPLQNVSLELIDASKFAKSLRSQELIVHSFITNGYHRQANDLYEHILFPELKHTLFSYANSPDLVALRKKEDEAAIIAQIALKDISSGLITKKNISRVVNQNDLYIISEAIMYVQTDTTFSKEKIISFQTPLVRSLYANRNSLDGEPYRAAALALPYVADYALQSYLVHTILANSSFEADVVASDSLQFVLFDDLKSLLNNKKSS